MNDIPSLPIPYHTGQMIVQARSEGLEGMHAKGAGFLEPLLAVSALLCEPQSSMVVVPGRGPLFWPPKLVPLPSVSRSVSSRSNGLGGDLAVSFIEQPGGE